MGGGHHFLKYINWCSDIKIRVILRLWEFTTWLANTLEWLHYRAAFSIHICCIMSYLYQYYIKKYQTCSPQWRFWLLAPPTVTSHVRLLLCHCLKSIWTGASARRNHHKCKMEVSALSSYLTAGSWADRSPLHDAASQGRLLALRTLILQVTEHNPLSEQCAHGVLLYLSPRAIYFVADTL